MKWKQDIKENITQVISYTWNTEGISVAKKILLIKEIKSNENPAISSIES